MRIFHICHDRLDELLSLPDSLPATGFLWVGCGRRQFEVHRDELQAGLQRWTGTPGLVDLHISDLLNAQLPSHFDDTSWYDMLVFRRLAAGAGSRDLSIDDEHGSLSSAQQALAAIDTSPVGFAVFDRVLLTVHPTDCQVRDHFALRLAQHAVENDLRGSGRMPAGPADLMLRMVNHMVDSYLELRRLLTRQLATVQAELLGAHNRRHDWQVLLKSRETLHLLEAHLRRPAQCHPGMDGRAGRMAGGNRHRRPARAGVAGRALTRCAGTHRTGAQPCAPAGAVSRSRRADALLGGGPPHQRHHAHADRADRDLPAAEPDHRHLRHELRGPAADPQTRGFLGRGGRDGRRRPEPGRLLLGASVTWAPTSARTDAA